MANRAWAKLVVLLVAVVAIGVGICIRWRSIGGGSDPLTAWGRGRPGLAERNYYIGRINRLIEKWAETGRQASRDRDGGYEDSYRTFLVIDLDEQAIWMEDDGIVLKNSHAELPGGMKWEVRHITPEDDKELTGRVVLKMRGAYTDQHKSERFHLVSDEQGADHFDFQFTATGGRGNYTYGTFNPQPVRSRSADGSRTPYGSLLVSAEEYEKYRVADASSAAEVVTAIEENEANWLRVEKVLYAQIEWQVEDLGGELRRMEIEPGPDFSAGHAEISGSNDSILRGLFGSPSIIDGYLQIDYVGEDVWYVKSAPHPDRPQLPAMRRHVVDLEFLVHPTSEVMGSKRGSLLTKGREIQKAAMREVESKWKVTLGSGATIEFIGICENPSAGKEWWGPDGSPLEYAPYINTLPYGQPHDGRKLYEFAWRIKHAGNSGGATRHGFQGVVGSYYRQIHDRYGFRIIEGLSAEGFSFDESRLTTEWRVSLAAGEWKTALVIEDEAGETKLLDKQRIILNPPEIEGGEIVVRCLKESAAGIRDYQVNFAAIVWEDGERKTVSLERYPEDVTEDRKTGLRETRFTINDMAMSQIESVCLRYRPYESVTFKNISLVPGEDQGFEILLGPAADESGDR